MPCDLGVGSPALLLVSSIRVPTIPPDASQFSRKQRQWIPTTRSDIRLDANFAILLQSCVTSSCTPPALNVRLNTMPSFNPPLSQTTYAPVSGESNTPSWLQLAFRVTFDEQEDSAGRWEVWTDLPSLGDDGKALTAPGEWHAIPFAAQTDGTGTSTSAHAHAKTSSIRTDGALILEPYVDEAEHHHSGVCLQAVTIVNPDEGASYAYTFRHIPPGSDEVHWLGGEGSNGVINFSSDADAAPENLKGFALAFGSATRYVTRSSGIICRTSANHYSQPPAIHLLPTKRIIVARLAVVDNTSASAPATGFITALASLPSQIDSRAKYTAVAIKELEKFDLASECPLSEVEGERAQGPSASAALTNLLSSVGTEVVQAAKVSPVSGDETPEVVAFTVGRGDEEHLVVYAPPQPAPKNVKVSLANFDHDSSWAVSIDGAKGYAYAPGDDLHVELAAGGTIAQTLTLFRFDEIPVQGSDSERRLLIAAPDGSATVIEGTASYQESEADYGTATDEENENAAPTEPSPELDSEPKSALAAFFGAIEGFFISFWTWVFGPALPDDEESEDIPTERTPLIVSPSLALSLRLLTCRRKTPS